ncbi:MAG TPA: hypothetical protein VGJ79_11175 [Candidatus Dormibacteraeota bacterium]
MLVVGLATAMMVGPGFVASLSMAWGGGLGEPEALPFIPVDARLLLESGRIVFAMALVPSVIKAKEME